MISVRNATPADLSVVLNMRAKLMSYENSVNSVVADDMDPTDLLRYNVDVTKDIVDQNGFTLLAFNDETPAGMIAFLPGRFVGHGGRLAKGVGFWVEEDFRGTTVAHRLWTEALRVLRSCTSAIQIITVAGNDLMEDLCERLSFVPVGTVWELEYGRGQWREGSQQAEPGDGAGSGQRPSGGAAEVPDGPDVRAANGHPWFNRGQPVHSGPGAGGADEAECPRDGK